MLTGVRSATWGPDGTAWRAARRGWPGPQGRADHRLSAVRKTGSRECKRRGARSQGPGARCFGAWRNSASESARRRWPDDAQPVPAETDERITCGHRHRRDRHPVRGLPDGCPRAIGCRRAADAPEESPDVPACVHAAFFAPVVRLPRPSAGPRMFARALRRGRGTRRRRLPRGREGGRWRTACADPRRGRRRTLRRIRQPDPARDWEERVAERRRAATGLLIGR